MAQKELTRKSVVEKATAANSIGLGEGFVQNATTNQLIDIIGREMTAKAIEDGDDREWSVRLEDALAPFAEVFKAVRAAGFESMGEDQKEIFANTVLTSVSMALSNFQGVRMGDSDVSAVLGDDMVRKVAGAVALADRMKANPIEAQPVVVEIEASSLLNSGAAPGVTTDVSDLVVDYSGITDEQSAEGAQWQEETLAYLEARKQVEDAVNSTTEAMASIAGIHKSALTTLTDYSPVVASFITGLGSDSVSIAKGFSDILTTVSPEQLAQVSAELGLTYDGLLESTQSYIEALNEQEKTIQETLDGFKTEATGRSETTARTDSFQEKYAGLDLRLLAFTQYQDIVAGIANTTAPQLLQAAEAAGWAAQGFVDDFGGIKDVLVEMNGLYMDLMDDLSRRINSTEDNPLTESKQSLVRMDKKYAKVGGMSSIAALGKDGAARHIQGIAGNYDQLSAMAATAGVSVEDLTADFSSFLGILDDIFDKEEARYESMKTFAKEYKDFVESLKLGDLSTLNPTQKLAEAKTDYQDLLAKAKAGDVEAMGKLQASAQTLLEKGKSYYASGDEYTKIYDMVTGDLSGLSISLEDMATNPTEEASKAVVSAIFGMDTHLLDIGGDIYDAIVRLIPENEYGASTNQALLYSIVQSIADSGVSAYEGGQRFVDESARYGIDRGTVAAAFGMSEDQVEGLLNQMGASFDETLNSTYKLGTSLGADVGIDSATMVNGITVDGAGVADIIQGYFSLKGISNDSVDTFMRSLDSAGISLDELSAQTGMSAADLEAVVNIYGSSFDTLTDKKYDLGIGLAETVGVDSSTMTGAINANGSTVNDIISVYFATAGISTETVDTFMLKVREAGISLEELSAQTGISAADLEGAANAFGNSFDQNTQAAYDFIESLENGTDIAGLSAMIEAAKAAGVTAEQVGSYVGMSGSQVAQLTAKNGLDFSGISDSAVLDSIYGIAGGAEGDPEATTRGIYEYAVNSGITSDRLAALTGTDRQSILDAAALYGLPAFANGGIITSPTIGLIGEAGPEAILPLTAGMGRTKVLTQIADRYGMPKLADGGIATDSTFALIAEEGPEAVVPLTEIDRFRSPRDSGSGESSQDDEEAALLQRLIAEVAASREENVRIRAVLMEMYKKDREDNAKAVEVSRQVGADLGADLKTSARLKQNQSDAQNGR